MTDPMEALVLASRPTRVVMAVAEHSDEMLTIGGETADTAGKFLHLAHLHCYLE